MTGDLDGDAIANGIRSARLKGVGETTEDLIYEAIKSSI